MKVYCLLPARSAFISEELPRLPHVSGIKQLLISSSQHSLSLPMAVGVIGGRAAPRVPAVTPECPGEQTPAPGRCSPDGRSGQDPAHSTCRFVISREMSNEASKCS